MPPEADSMQRHPGVTKVWWAVCIFAVAAVLSYIDRQILLLLAAPIQSDLGISDVQLTILQGAAFAVLYSVIGLPNGRVADPDRLYGTQSAVGLSLSTVVVPAIGLCIRCFFVAARATRQADVAIA